MDGFRPTLVELRILDGANLYFPRPAVKLTQTELGQITNYAVAVSRDDRFKSPDVAWEFFSGAVAGAIAGSG